MSIKHLTINVSLLLMQLGNTKHFSMYKCIYFGIFRRLLLLNYRGAVNPNTPYSPPVCSMFHKIVQYLKFLIFFPGVTIMTSRHIDDVIVKILRDILKGSI